MKKVNNLTNRWYVPFLITLNLFAVVSVATACTIPVFQYALDYWPPDTYEVIVFHKGPLSPEEQVALDRLGAAAADDKRPANFHLRAINLAKSEGIALEIVAPSNLPWISVYYPSNARATGEMWSGPFTPEAVGSLLDSPTRKQIVDRLLDGESGVWVLLESGDSELDNEAASLLNRQLLKMELHLKVAIPDESGAPDHQNGESVRFSSIRLSRNDAAEAVFVQMLLGTEWDLKAVQRPIAFPIFGRGRALYALVGDGINAENIKAACEFLIGWCSCQVKDLNPGVDLLMSASWGGTIREDSETYQDTLSMLGLADSTVEDVETVGPLRRNLLAIIAVQILIVVFVAVGVVVWRMRRET